MQRRGFLDVDGRLIGWPAKERDRLPLLRALAERFAAGQDYSERQVNDVLRDALGTDATDHVTLRRYLVDYGLLHREPNGSRYWREAPSDGAVE